MPCRHLGLGKGPNYPKPARESFQREGADARGHSPSKQFPEYDERRAENLLPVHALRGSDSGASGVELGLRVRVQQHSG